jgi:decaprenyl-phosphate phosphoribosyltransferase
LTRLPASVRLLRPQQWAKNLFVFAPLLFSGKFRDLNEIQLALAAFAIFCAASSLVYVLNDLLDLDADRAHPIKRHKRPLAAEQITTAAARTVIAILATLIGAALVQPPSLAWPIAGYLLINVFYNLGLRAIPVVDLAVISVGFVARVWAGAAAIAVPLTLWIVVDTFFLALYLASMKRRNEVRLMLSSSRKSINGYSSRLINAISLVAALGALAGYVIFAIQVRQALAFTIPLVALGLWRFKWLSDSLEGAESPTEVLIKDWPMLAVSAAWAIACWFVLSRA